MGQETDQGTSTPTHDSGTGKGEEKSSMLGKEAGRHDKEEKGANRPTGGSTARDSTSVNAEAEEPIDPSMPHMPPA